jgi:hypothetical protein
MASHLTGIYDVNRSTVLPDDDFTLVEAWAVSLQKLQVNGIIFHNNFSEATCQLYQHAKLQFIRVTHDAAFNPNIYRYIIYREYLRLYAAKITSLFLTDVSDVEMVNNPFIDPVFLTNSKALFCGDEPEILYNEWMIDHATHLRNGIINYAAYESTFKQAVLLNCGVIGGNILIMQPFIEQLAAIHEQYNLNNTTAYTGDMGAFNYLVRTSFNNNLMHGYPVNTIFKAYELDRQDCWFRHK